MDIKREINSFQASKPLPSEERVYNNYPIYAPAPINSQDILTSIKHKFESEVVGYDKVKRLVMKIIKAGIENPQYKKIHLDLDGAPATGKTFIMQTIFEAIGADQCIWYDATMSTQVGLLDHFVSMGSKLKNIRYVCLDELDKMKKEYQYGVLNATESGYMMETKYGRHREVKTGHMTFFATSNYIEKIIEPLRSRFMIYNFPEYTPQQFQHVAMTILTNKFKFKPNYAQQIIDAVRNEIPNCTIRTIRQVATLIENESDVKETIEIFKNTTEYH